VRSGDTRAAGGLGARVGLAPGTAACACACVSGIQCKTPAAGGLIMLFVVEVDYDYGIFDLWTSLIVQR
jgi:hypothetical protein